MLFRRRYEPQTCDMGFSYEEYIPRDTINLRELFKEIETWNCWGTITIMDYDNKVLRIFDYNVYNGEHQFYHHMSGFAYHLTINEVKCRSCFMNKDIEIYLNRTEKWE